MGGCAPSRRMNGRLVAVVALIVGAAGATGCIEALSSLAASDGEVTAMTNRDLADGAARAWNPTAELRAAFALEAPNLTEEYPADPDVGNGRAPLWLYGYAASNGTEARAFHVTADGQVRVLNESFDGVPDMGEAVASWSIDSDRAVEIARSDAGFDAVAAHEEALVMEALGAEDGMTLWAIMAYSPAGQALAVVDASDGTLVTVESFDMAFDMPAFPGMPGRYEMGPQVEIHDEGTLDADEATKEYGFRIARADVGTIELNVAKTLPTDRLRWSILDASGEPVAGGSVQGFQMQSRGTFDFTLEEPGDYVLVLSYAPMGMLPLGGVDYEMLFLVGPPTSVDVDVDCC